MMDTTQESQLTQGGECYLHYHPDDRVPTHDTHCRLQELSGVITKSASYTVSRMDDWVCVSATATMTLPPPLAGKEFYIVNIGAAATVTIATPTGYTVNGSTSINFNTQWMVKHLKPISTTGYVAF